MKSWVYFLNFVVSMIFKPGLYIVSTPIGNLDDITLRAIETLKNSTIILCEDTRVSKKLLAKHSINKIRLQVYNDHSDEIERDNIFRLIDQGGIISLISDAGTPLISDPGYKLVRELKEKGYHIDVLPGVSSPITALTISGLPSDKFLFTGFLPKTMESKKKIFTELSQIKATLIFFETATRLISSLLVARDVLGNREMVVARELTKRYQEIKSGSIDEIIDFYQTHAIRGEIVLLIASFTGEQNKEITEIALQELLKLYLAKGWSAKSVTDLAYEKFSKIYSKKDIYSIANKMKG